MNINEVESPIDLRNFNDASEWAAEVNVKRPWRYEFFAIYVSEINTLKIKNPKILEIGSGPGYLAKILLENLSNISYTAIDFSEAMHQLSKEHLGELSTKVKYLVTNFKDLDWFQIVEREKYDVVIIHQALHELRHKSYARNFHIQVKNNLLNKGSIYIITDHIVADNGMKNDELYMTIEEHLKELSLAGFAEINILKEKNALCSFKTISN
ncbi:class I SAM-dependent methyltransferase [Acinetobacter pittii]|uniref:class I SAM-dependent methyltransferase n=1 Tax=Acinetobacter pittii TaxID=48296 RepID=UPI0024DE9C91|nr:class I SAM-dependent methyltransferase [Acinetobacter pittii]